MVTVAYVAPAYVVENEVVKVHVHLHGVEKEAVVVEEAGIPGDQPARSQLGYLRYLPRAQSGAQVAETQPYGAADVECDGHPWCN